MTGRAETIGREAVADPPKLVFARAATAVDDFCAELLSAETRVLVGLVPAQVVLYVQRANPEAQLA
jgi:hypothetical protein